MMRKKRGIALQVVMALALCAALGLSASGATYVDNLFSEYLLDGEKLYKESSSDEEWVRRAYRNDDGDWVTRESLDWVTRPVLTSTRLDADAKVIDVVEIYVPAGKTLTIDTGVTLTVVGGINVDGKLINRGTIVVGDVTAYRQSRLGNIISRIHNYGEIVNYGTIEIARGELVNSGRATLENSGTIDITNRDRRLLGLVNETLKTQATTYGGYINNTGTINVLTEEGYGIRISDGSTLENKGKVLVGETGRISGTITGTRAQRMGS